MLNAFVEAGLSKLEGPLPAGARLLPPYQCAFVESSLFKPKPISDPPTPPDASISIVLPSARPRQPPARASQQAAGPAAAPAPAVAAAPAAATGRWSKQAAAARGGGSRGQRLPGEDESVPAAADVAAVGLAGLAGDELMFTAHAGMGSAADGFVAVSASTAGGSHGGRALRCRASACTGANCDACWCARRRARERAGDHAGCRHQGHAVLRRQLRGRVARVNHVNLTLRSGCACQRSQRPSRSRPASG